MIAIQLLKKELMGRPREFDIDRAVEISLDLFWRNGYNGTSLTNLTNAMGITPPSFYFAFGSKEKLFQLVFNRYVTEHFAFFKEALSQSTARSIVERLLYGFADTFTNGKHPSGCLLINSSLPCSDDADPIRRKLAEGRDEIRKELCSRLKKAKSSGDLPEEADPSALARYVLMLGWGMAIEAQSGASRKELYRTVIVALDSWPK
jgi:AcrR family transcriptional regulator